MPDNPRRFLANSGLLVAVISLVAGGASAAAQEAICALQEVGRVACLAGKLCTCRSAPGSPATRLPDGFRWDCGILRPSCGGPVPATLDPWPSQLPDGLAINQSRTIINTVPRHRGYRLRP